MIEGYLRPQVQPVLNRMSSILMKMRINHMMVTCCALISGVGAAVLLAMGDIMNACIALWVSGFLDVMDGTIARMKLEDGPWGAYNDLIADRMVEASLMIGFALWQPQHMLAYMLFMVALLCHFAAFVTAGALFKNRGKKSMHYDSSLIERPETFMFFTAMMLMPQYIPELIYTLSALMILSAMMRYVRVHQYAKATSQL